VDHSLTLLTEESYKEGERERKVPESGEKEKNVIQHNVILPRQQVTKCMCGKKSGKQRRELLNSFSVSIKE
jgi:hypothetical protein